MGLATTAHAQWLKHPTPGIPRTPDGRPNLSAPAPRTPDGKPDFSGVWGFDGGPSMFYLPAGLKPNEIKPFVADLLKERGENFGSGDQQVRCLPEGPRFNHFPALPRKIVQTPSLIVVLSEDLTFRQILLDGRPLPENPSPSFMGYAVGHWEGDTLVVESIGYKDTTWLDFAGNPHSEALRITERYRRVDFGHIEIEETFRDPDIYSRPLTAKVRATLVPDTDLLEYVCAENEKDRPRMIGTAAEESKGVKPVKIAPEILSRYVRDRYKLPMARKPHRGFAVAHHHGERGAVPSRRTAHTAVRDRVRLGRWQSSSVLQRRQRSRDAFRDHVGGGRLAREATPGRALGGYFLFARSNRDVSM